MKFSVSNSQSTLLLLASLCMFFSLFVIIFSSFFQKSIQVTTIAGWANDLDLARWRSVQGANSVTKVEKELFDSIVSEPIHERDKVDDGKGLIHDTQDENHETMPLITAIIPSFKGSRFIDRSVESVLNQTYPNIEVLVSVDYSEDTEETVRVLKQLKGDFKVHVQKERIGWLRNFNFLMSQAKGDYFVYLADDDYIPPHMYASLYDCFLQNPKAVNCFPYVQCVGDECDTLYRHKLGIFRQASIRGRTTRRVKKAIQETTALCMMKGLIRKHPVFDRFQYYMKEVGPTSKSAYADLLQLVQLSIAGEIIQVNVPYFKHFRSGTLSSNEVLGNRTQREDQDVAIDLAAETFHAAYMHASSEQGLYKIVRAKLWKKMEEISRSRSEADSTNALDGHHVEVEFQKKLNARTKVAVLGGGIQGTVMALLFRKYGYDVAIFDQAPGLMQRASSNGENRIHLGTEYSKDSTMETGEKMLKGALRFSSYIEYLLGERIDWAELESRKHLYLVPHDSLLKADEVDAYFSKLDQMYQQMITEDPSLSYIGKRPETLYRRVPVPTYVKTSHFEGAFETEEHSISFGPLRETLRRKLGEESVDVLVNTRVHEVVRNNVDSSTREWNDGMKPKKFTILTSNGSHNVDLVVNCLWEGRYGIDKKLGWSQWSGNNLRLKFGISTSPIKELDDFPSVSIVNGPFGDFANYPGEGRMYFSWYNISRSGMVYSQDLEIPSAWQALVNGLIPAEIESYQLQEQEAKFNELFLPDVPFRFERPKLTANFILGDGELDVDKMESGLHKRIGHPIRYEDGYWSISTQKFTTAPYNAYLLEKEFLKPELSLDSNVEAGMGMDMKNSEECSSPSGQRTYAEVAKNGCDMLTSK